MATQGDVIRQAASQLGVDPVDLATVIGYETIGSYSPSKMGGVGGKYMGLIQFSPDMQKQYGVTKTQSFEDQMLNSVVPYLRDNGVVPGTNLTDLYSTILTGAPGHPNRADVNGTVAQHVARMMASPVRTEAANLVAGEDTPQQVASAQGSGLGLASLTGQAAQSLWGASPQAASDTSAPLAFAASAPFPMAPAAQAATNEAQPAAPGLLANISSGTGDIADALRSVAALQPVTALPIPGGGTISPETAKTILSGASGFFPDSPKIAKYQHALGALDMLNGGYVPIANALVESGALTAAAPFGMASTAAGVGSSLAKSLGRPIGDIASALGNAFAPGNPFSGGRTQPTSPAGVFAAASPQPTLASYVMPSAPTQGSAAPSMYASPGPTGGGYSSGFAQPTSSIISAFSPSGSSGSYRASPAPTSHPGTYSEPTSAFARVATAPTSAPRPIVSAAPTSAPSAAPGAPASIAGETFGSTYQPAGYMGSIDFGQNDPLAALTPALTTPALTAPPPIVPAQVAASSLQHPISRKATTSSIPKIAGGVLGSLVGGPLGGIAGSYLGGLLGGGAQTQWQTSISQPGQSQAYAPNGAGSQYSTSLGMYSTPRGQSFPTGDVRQSWIGSQGQTVNTYTDRNGNSYGTF